MRGSFQDMRPPSFIGSVGGNSVFTSGFTHNGAWRPSAQAEIEIPNYKTIQVAVSGQRERSRCIALAGSRSAGGWSSSTVVRTRFGGSRTENVLPEPGALSTSSSA